MNKNILVTVVALLLSACGSNVEINDLESSDGLSYLDGELFTGTAEELNINNQLKQTQEFDNGKLLTRLIYLDNKPFYEENYSTKQATAYPIICSSECIVESNDFEDIVFKGIHLENVVFINSNFKNVVIEGMGNNFSILGNIKFQDSNLDLTIQGKVATIPWFVRDEGEELTKTVKTLTDNEFIGAFSVSFNNVSGSITTDNVESFFGLSIEDSSLENISLNNEFKDKDLKDLNNLNISPFLMISNTDVDNLFYQDLSSDRERYYSGRKPVAVKQAMNIENSNHAVFLNSNVKNIQALHLVGDISCDNSTFTEGYLPRVTVYCEDMGEAFDEYAFADSMEEFSTFSKLYSVAALVSSENKKFREKMPSYPPSQYPLKYFSQSDYRSNEENLKKAISEGNAEFLYTYFTEIYFLFMGNDYSFREIQFCSFNRNNIRRIKRGMYDMWIPSGVAFLNWYDTSSYPQCSSEYNRLEGNSLDKWMDIDPKFRSSVEPEILDMAMQSMNRSYPSKVYSERLAKYPGKLLSLEKRKELAESYVKKHHDFSELKNCLRGNDQKNAITTLLSNPTYLVKSKVDDPSSTEDRLKLSEAIYMTEKVEKDEGVIKLSACIENNASVVSQSSFAAYQPFSDLVSVVEEEVSLAKDIAAQEKKLAKEQRAKEIELLFKNDVFLDGLDLAPSEAIMFSVYAKKCSSVGWMGRNDARYFIKATDALLDRAILREEINQQTVNEKIEGMNLIISMGGFTSEKKQTCQGLTLMSKEFVQKTLGL